jgi:pimeloyl-ACP methyl ester carboxylesterase
MLTTSALAAGRGACAKEMTTKTWQRASLEGIELEYRTVGVGQPVVLVHAGVFADWFEPLIEEPSLSGGRCLLVYHRVGYAGSSHVPGPISIAQQAAQLRALMLSLGITRAHIVGHSSGGNIAMQLALDAPQTVQSLVLLEPAVPVPSGSAPLRPGATSAVDLFRAGDKAGAVDAFMKTVAGPTYRAVLDRMLPGAFAQAVADADTFFGQELPAVREWKFGAQQAALIRQPALVVMGGRSHEVSPIWQQRQDLLLASLDNAEPFVLDGATHMLHLHNPRGLAERLAIFFARQRQNL